MHESGQSGVADKQFPWVPLYLELAEKLIEWRHRQLELIEILKTAEHAGFVVPNLQDEARKGLRTPLEVIDPFTFFGAFNRRVKKESRIGILQIVHNKLALSSAVPTNFDGLPILHPQHSWFFDYAYQREPHSIDTLWDFAEAIVRQPPESVSSELFARCYSLRQVGPVTLTMGMFWLRPDLYFALDGNNITYVKSLGVKLDKKNLKKDLNWSSYLALRTQIQNKTNNLSWPQLSLNAWKSPTDGDSTGDAEQTNRYWLFQGASEKYDLAAALRAGDLHTWNVSQHKDDIQEGDRVVVWQSGQNSGCYALATVASAVGRFADTEGAKYWKSGSPHDDRLAVRISVDSAFPDAPIGKERVANHKELQQAPIGRQGTNFKITAEQFLAFEELSRGNEPMNLPTVPMNTSLLPSLNIILYGPPGTGKTHSLQRDYMNLFEDQPTVTTNQERAALLVKDLSWWECIALALLDTQGNSGKVAQIVGHPFVQAKLRTSSSRTVSAKVWGELQTHTKLDCPHVNYTKRSEPSIFSKDEDSTWSIDVNKAYTEVPDFKNMIDAYRRPDVAPRRRYRFTTFHQAYSYEDFVEGIRPRMADDEGGLEYEIRPGVFLQIVQEARDNPSQKFALFIDEINRGNVANIFGELISLIEDDKRTGEKCALTAILPYSRNELGVPKNLYIIGTMNTADRSVEALDTALRRRFTFLEMAPDRKHVPERVGSIDLRRLFDTVNTRIERLLDRDKCIGHSYFMDVKNLEDLRRVFAKSVLPLLREYFYGNAAKVGMVLGERFVTRADTANDFAAGDWGNDELDDKVVWTFADVSLMKESDFASIYA